jgi:hypothetical protein
MAGKVVTQLIRPSQSVYTVTDTVYKAYITCVCSFFLETVANQAFHGCFQAKHPEIYKGKHISSPKQKISQNLLYSFLDLIKNYKLSENYSK